MENHIIELAHIGDYNSLTKEIKNNPKYKFKFYCEKCGTEFIKAHASIRRSGLVCTKCLRKETNQYKPWNERYSPEELESKRLNRNKILLKKYGVINISQLDETKKKVKKTVIERYGVSAGFLQASAMERAKINSHTKEAKEKQKQTCLQKYGLHHSMTPENVMKTKQSIKERYGDDAQKMFLEKRKETNLNKFGVDSTFKLTKVIEGTIERNKQNTINFKNNFIEKYEIEIIKPLSDIDIVRCKKCNSEWEIKKSNYGYWDYKLCPTCFPKDSNRSQQEIEIANFIKSIYSGTIIENDRTVLKPKELDIYLPDLKLAIECNGNFWHGFTKYHPEPLKEFKKQVEFKRLQCQNLGIRLITINECDYLDRPDVFHRFLENVISPKRSVFARKSIIKEIDTKTARDFCVQYHVNGFRGGRSKYGMYYDDELIMVAIFANHKKYENECIRLCYKTGVSIPGGWEKMQKHFGKKFLHYVNLNYFPGENKTGIGYRVIINNKVLHRNALQKKTGLYKHCHDIDPNLSDFDNCLNNNGIMIFDQGNDIRSYNC